MQGLASPCRTRPVLRAATDGEEGGSRRGLASPTHHVCTQCLEGTAPGWPCLPRGLQRLSTELSGAFQGRQLDEALGTDAKPVYCVYYAAALGVTYLNPSASRRGDGPRTMLLAVSNPLNSLLKIQHVAVAAVPWKKKHGVHQSHVEPDLHLGSGHVNQGNACCSRSVPLEAFLPLEQRQGHTPAGGTALNPEPFHGIIPDFPWGAKI